MSRFRAGKFDRARIHPFIRRFAPVQSVESLYDVDVAALKAAGKRVILIDVDNTLVVWRSKDIAAATHDWVDKAKAMGFDLCIISNTRNVERLKHLSERLGILYMIGRFKPSRYMFLQALERFKAKPWDAVMIGDQLFTDVFGANRSKIDAIWVKQMAPIDLGATKISRFGERLLSARLYAALHKEEPKVDAAGSPIAPMIAEAAAEPEEDLAVGGTAAFELLQIPIVRQFLKFVIVGLSSTAIDKGLLILLSGMPWGDSSLGEVMSRWLQGSYPQLFAYATRPSEAAVPVLNTFTAGLAILNSFVWNRRWTFKIRGKEHRAIQLQKFFVVALIGFVLNVAITTAVHAAVKGDEGRSLLIASIVATVVVAIWNFSGQKLWTFKHKH